MDHKNLKLNIRRTESKYISKDQVGIVLELSNESDKEFSISSDSILLDGFTSDKFRIFTPELSQIKYQGRNVKYSPEEILIKPHSSIQSHLNLADAYDFSDAECGDTYSVEFESRAIFCTSEPEPNQECLGETLTDTIQINFE